MRDFEEEYLPINGIKEYLLHYKASENKPVVLFIHGGPGLSESFFAYELKKHNNNSYTLVCYDQRGSGKTLIKNPQAKFSIDILLNDLHDTIEYLKKIYNKNKIVLLCHSWGTVLGSFYSKLHPENVQLYIGTGQVIDIYENEFIGFKKLKKEIMNKKYKKDIKILSQIGEYPSKPFNKLMFNKMTKVQKLQGKYRTSIYKEIPLLNLMINSPVFNMVDILAALAGPRISFPLLKEFDSRSIYSLNRRYECPICYILGDKDYMTPYTIAAEYYSTIIAPYKKLYIIKDAGHITYLEQPIPFNNILKEVIFETVNNI